MKTLKVVYTNIKYVLVLVNEENTPVMTTEEMVLPGKLSEEKARKLLREKHGEEAIIRVESCELRTEKRKISIESLIENSVLVEDEEAVDDEVVED